MKYQDTMILNFTLPFLSLQTVEWQNKGNEILLAIGRRVPLCKNEEEAHQLMDEVDEFLEKGDKPQKARLQKLNEMARELYGIIIIISTHTILDNRTLIFYKVEGCHNKVHYNEHLGTPNNPSLQFFVLTF